jgi:hypothetical protein
MSDSQMPAIENKITTGNLLTIAAMLIGGAVAWGAARADIAAIKDRVISVEIAAERSRAERQATLAGQETRLRAVEASQARSDERFNSVLAILGRIEARLERIESR